ncbi:MAG: 16S rRNA (adenine(1518)-N(6)/adenine(1519)-N(6))-dimethyltransferase RsmA [Methanomassiliicoccaceae archaeon]|nr:16S rRNA (adenine(1518)-N(6)/adenine(1519)-N(6))-dimethyltransferase RsmA [Methanomassiliicoccaceae archaeon]MCL2145860.1 16S rRNA (adenine(1518)-N(6)/adenine(1519)-N(6))-dimethyltransferase RsmA [Methanomassiliicoccaceae archaeon]
MNRGETGRLMAETGVIPKKSKGQNFLTDDRVADRQVDFAKISPGDRVLEIGPGLGILTSRLIERTGDVTCIEIDDALAGHIEKEYGGRLCLIRGDAVKVPFPPFDVFVSNLPYSVSTPIIFKLLEHDFKRGVVMVQKEFADRMTADVGSPDYSRLTVNLFYKADCRILEKVPSSRFKPQPKVDSAIVEIMPRPAPFKVFDEGSFFRVTEATFNHRRKKIGTSLRAAGMIKEGWNVPFLESRIEDLRPAEIADIANSIFLCSGGFKG